MSKIAVQADWPGPVLIAALVFCIYLFIYMFFDTSDNNLTSLTYAGSVRMPTAAFTAASWDVLLGNELGSVLCFLIIELEGCCTVTIAEGGRQPYNHVIMSEHDGNAPGNPQSCLWDGGCVFTTY